MTAARSSLLRRLSTAPTAVRLTVGLLAVVLLQVVVLLIRVRPDIAVYPDWRLVLDLSLLAVPAVLTIDLALRGDAPRDRLRKGVPVAVILAIAAAAGISSLPMAHAHHPASVEGVGDDLAFRALQCFSIGVALTVLVVLVLRSCTASRRSALVTVSLATASGLAAVIACQLHCPLTHPLHLWSGHVSVLLMALFGGFTVGRRRARGSSASRSRSRSASGSESSR